MATGAGAGVGTAGGAARELEASTGTDIADTGLEVRGAVAVAKGGVTALVGAGCAVESCGCDCESDIMSRETSDYAISRAKY